MNSSGSSGMTRTSSEESEVSSIVSVDLLESGSSDEIEYSSILNSSSSSSNKNNDKSTMKNPFGFTPSKKSAKPDPTSYVSIAAAGVNRVAELLRRLQVTEEEIPNADKTSTFRKSNKDKDLVREAIRELTGLRQRTLCQVPVRHRQRLVDSVERSASSADASTPLLEFTSLFGRCFNLSMNLKILAGNGCGASMDSTLATRILSDLRVVETSMKERLEEREAVTSEKLIGSLMTGLKLASSEKTSKGRPRLML